MDNLPSENQVEEGKTQQENETSWQMLESFEIESKPGNERAAVNQVMDAIQYLQLPSRTIDRLKTAVAETTMNAMEYGNGYQLDLPVIVEIKVSEKKFAVMITDHGVQKQISKPEQPDLELKLSGLQTPRGWGLYIINKMVDDMRIVNNKGRHTVELYFYIKENDDGI